MTRDATLVWFRRDLRLADNPALANAVAGGGTILPVFLWSSDEESPWQPGGASRWWLHRSLVALADELASRGSRLIVRQGRSLDALVELAAETKAARVVWNRCYDPATRARDEAVKSTLRAKGIEAESFNAGLLCEPWEIETKSRKPFQVFTPFWRAAATREPPPTPTAAPKNITSPERWPKSLDIDDLRLLPRIAWDTTMRETWMPGEKGAWSRLRRFLKKGVFDYAAARDEPARDGISRLSPHLHFGEIGPRQIWHAAREAADDAAARGKVADGYVRQLYWREFAHHLLYHFPHTDSQPLREEFSAFPWEDDQRRLRLWQKGRTGYPLVDAGMRELWATGWMHNRVRMVVASFLVKDLLIPWQAGAAWFWDTLVDADLANNTLGWQWTAGCGADAAPYFRVFNPTSQAERFDGSGEYVRNWVPELKRLPDKWIHRPFDAPAEELSAAGVVMGETYPRPIVDHDEARKRALEAFAQIRRASAESAK